MPFDDLAEDDEEVQDTGEKALDDLAGTVSSSGSDTTSEEIGTDDDDRAKNADEEGDSSTSEYDPMEDPAFPTAKNQTQHSVYCLPDTWEAIDGSSGLLFEAEVNLRRSGYANVQKRELHNALLVAAAEQLTAEDLAEAFIEARENGSSEIDEN